MNELANIYRGKSFSIGFTIPDEYDESRIEDLKVNIGTKVYQHTIVQGVIGVNLTSNDTAKMVGRQDVVLTIEDSLFGVQKLNCGYVYVSSTISKFQSESFSDVYDVMVMLSFYSERLSVDHVLFDYLKGKSAYEYAVEGGYLGTEEQFYLDLAKAAIAVPYTGADKNVDLGANGITVDNVIFNEEHVSTIDPLKLQYNPAEKTIEFGLKDGGILQLGKEMFEEYTNIDTVALTNGMIVSTAAISGNRKGIKRTDFTSLTSIRSIVGMVTVASIGTNQSGRVTTKGIINELNTNGIGEGSQLWGNPSVLGGWSGSKPAKPQYAVQIGQVVVAHATVGSIELNIAKDVKFSDLADVNGSTNLIDNTDTIPKRDADGIIREISVADIKADFKSDTDLIYEPLLGFTPENTANKGQANGYASLGADGLVPSNQLPSFVDDVLEFANLSAFPVTGEQGKIYVALDTNKTYRWSGSTYIYITSGAVDSVAGKTGVVTLVKADVGLGNVDNTSDVNKPISSATQTALNGKVSLTGNEIIADVKTFLSSPIVPTPTNATDAANKGYIDAIGVPTSNLINVERATADMLAHLLGRIETLEQIIASSIYTSVQANTISAVDSLKYKGAEMILTGTAAPAVAPDFIGQFFIDTTNGVTYQAKGITNAADWKATSNA